MKDFYLFVLDLGLLHSILLAFWLEGSAAANYPIRGVDSTLFRILGIQQWSNHLNKDSVFMKYTSINSLVPLNLQLGMEFNEIILFQEA